MSKIADKIKGIGLGVVEKYALIQLDAKEKRDKKRARKEEARKMEESFVCPYCHIIRYTDDQYYAHKTKKKDVRIERQYGFTYINFFECAKCKKLMGVETTNFTSAGMLRSAFALRDKDD